jgi:hypothetical protein
LYLRADDTGRIRLHHATDAAVPTAIYPGPWILTRDMWLDVRLALRTGTTSTVEVQVGDATSTVTLTTPVLPATAGSTITAKLGYTAVKDSRGGRILVDDAAVWLSDE